jgi:protein gp37
MAQLTNIEWCDHTFNPWIGCTKVSPGCANCYAAVSTRARVLRAAGHETWGKGATRSRTKTWSDPLKWNKWTGSLVCEDCGKTWAGMLRTAITEATRCTPGCNGRVRETRQRVFCASLADWLDDEVPIEWLADLLALIDHTPNLDWLLLTKRPQNFEKRMGEVEKTFFGLETVNGMQQTGSGVAAQWLFHSRPPSNVWLGTTVEDQTRADERIPKLIRIPAKIHFLSCEPLLGPVNLHLLGGYPPQRQAEILAMGPPAGMVDWIIAGGESGSQARPMNPDWARSLRDQCQAAGVPFFFKQWGEYQPFGTTEGIQKLPFADYVLPTATSPGFGFLKCGKTKAGRLLDGIEHHAFPALP